jgi:hypothetical protein
VDRIVFFGRIGAGELEDDLATTRVLGKEPRYIVDLVIENYPAAFGRVVLCDCCSDQYNVFSREQTTTYLQHGQRLSPYCKTP